MNRRNPRKSSVRKKLRELRDKGTVVSDYPEAVSLVGVPSSEFDPETDEPVEGDDGGDGDEGDEEEQPPRIEANIRTGERTLYVDGEAVDTSTTDRPECSEDGCQNPRFADLSTCEKCAGMPEQDWREGVE